jgi:hypothetical protein
MYTFRNALSAASGDTATRRRASRKFGRRDEVAAEVEMSGSSSDLKSLRGCLLWDLVIVEDAHRPIA